jgi:SRSO17 transposase
MIEAGLSVWATLFPGLCAALAPVFAQARSRFTAFDYVRGLCAAAERRTCWQLAEIVGHGTPRRLQALLAEYVWDAADLVTRVRTFLIEQLGDPAAVLAFDETAELKKGAHTVGVARQYAGITGQIENCQTVVFCAYITERAHALIDFMLYVPKPWIGDAARRLAAKVPPEIVFATKPELAIAILDRAVAALVPFAWVVADEVYGRSGALRAAIEAAGKGYVLAIPVDFTVATATGRHPAAGLHALLDATLHWEERSCGRGCKGHRYYQWAWIATASPHHDLLIRRNPTDHTQITYFFCYVPPDQPTTLATLVTIAGRRWPVEECFQQGKGQVGLDCHQVRLWHSWHRHTALAIAALALLAVATARPATTPANDPEQATEPDPQPEPTLAPPIHPEPAQTTATVFKLPEQWRDTAPLPNHAHANPPANPGHVRVSVPEARRLLNLAASAVKHNIKIFHTHWSNWRRRHQARARWHHYRTRLRRDLAT